MADTHEVRSGYAYGYSEGWRAGYAQARASACVSMDSLIKRFEAYAAEKDQLGFGEAAHGWRMAAATLRGFGEGIAAAAAEQTHLAMRTDYQEEAL